VRENDIRKAGDRQIKNDFKFCKTPFFWTWMAIPLFVCGFPKDLYAQQTVTTPGKSDSQTFETVLNQIAKRGNITIIAEGHPLKETLSDTEISGLFSTGEPLSTVLGKIASAYDYTVRRYGTVYVLQKRFTDPNDFPSVTLPEVGTCILDVRKTTNALNPKFEGSAFLNPLSTEFVSTLTENQISQMSGEGGGISVTSLSPEQQQTLRRITYHYFIQYCLISFDDIETILERMLRKGTAFKRQAVNEVTYFGYEFPVRTQTPTVTENAKREFIIMNNAEGSVSRYNITVKNHGGSVDLGSSAKSDPDKAGDGHSTMSDRRNKTETVTVESICASLNQREVSQNTSRRFSIDPEFVTLPVTIANLASTDSRTLWEAIAALYGLKVYAMLPDTKIGGNDNTTFRLSRPRVLVAKIPAELRAALMNAIPEPFLRACNQDNPNETASSTNSLLKSRQTSTRNLDTEKIIALRFAALKQLRTLVEPRLLGNTDSGLTLEDIGESGRQALAVYLLTGLLDPRSGISSLLKTELPDSIQRFDEAILTRTEYEKEGKRFYSLTLDIADPNMKNGKRPTLGVFDVEVKN
jgi:hypothetical protein